MIVKIDLHGHQPSPVSHLFLTWDESFLCTDQRDVFAYRRPNKLRVLVQPSRILLDDRSASHCLGPFPAATQ